MPVTFYKYHGTGNDFIIIDNRSRIFPKHDEKRIRKMCSRRFGIGADGLLLLEESELADFKMIYFNADGKVGSMCGNGGRCIVHFAHLLGVFKNKTVFEAVDGLHTAQITEKKVRLKMNDVAGVILKENVVFLDTGSPHHVQWVTGLETYPVFENGKKIRNQLYGKQGSNINFIEQTEANKVSVRTYERGVEAETLSCGTGVTAVAIALHATGKSISDTIEIKTRGGTLQVEFSKDDTGYKNIFLTGEATLVFKGEWL